MINPGSYFDDYARKARLYPALLTLLPALVTLAGWYPGSITGAGPVAITMVGAAGVFFFLATLARSAGRRAELRLLKKWGGWPSTLFLRHRSDEIPTATRDRYHRFLKQQGHELPTVAEEARSPDKADGAYASAVRWLKEQPLARESRMVRRENAEYGFRRNLRGLKPMGVLVCVFSIVGWGAAAVLMPSSAHYTFPQTLVSQVPFSAAVALAFDLASLVAWVSVVRDPWVREAGDNYAVALLATCDLPER